MKSRAAVALPTPTDDIAGSMLETLQTRNFSLMVSPFAPAIATETRKGSRKRLTAPGNLNRPG
jgi:hypothetical protein